MIVFDLDGTLANCEHRRHFVYPLKNKGITTWVDSTSGKKSYGHHNRIEITSTGLNKNGKKRTF